jgi:hypothetical protein
VSIRVPATKQGNGGGSDGKAENGSCWLRGGFGPGPYRLVPGVIGATWNRMFGPWKVWCRAGDARPWNASCCGPRLEWIGGEGSTVSGRRSMSTNWPFRNKVWPPLTCRTTTRN